MTDLKEQARRLIELDGERTPGEWEIYGGEFITVEPTCCGRGAQSCCGEPIAAPVPFNVYDELNSAFIAHTANHAPAIAQAYFDQCEEIERLREALQSAADNYVAVIANSEQIDTREVKADPPVASWYQALGDTDD